MPHRTFLQTQLHNTLWCPTVPSCRPNCTIHCGAPPYLTADPIAQYTVVPHPTFLQTQLHNTLWCPTLPSCRPSCPLPCDAPLYLPAGQLAHYIYQQLQASRNFFGPVAAKVIPCWNLWIRFLHFLFSPVSTIPWMLHNQSSVPNRRELTSSTDSVVSQPHCRYISMFTTHTAISSILQQIQKSVLFTDLLVFVVSRAERCVVWLILLCAYWELDCVCLCLCLWLCLCQIQIWSERTFFS
jgi:hypothetical protein